MGGGWWKVLHLLNVPHCKKIPKPFCNKEHKIVTDSQDTTKFVSNCTYQYYIQVHVKNCYNSVCSSIDVIVCSFLTRECAHAHERVIAIVDFSLGRSVGWLVGSVVNFWACAVNEF